VGQVTHIWTSYRPTAATARLTFVTLSLRHISPSRMHLGWGCRCTGSPPPDQSASGTAAARQQRLIPDFKPETGPDEALTSGTTLSVLLDKRGLVRFSMQRKSQDAYVRPCTRRSSSGSRDTPVMGG